MARICAWLAAGALMLIVRSPVRVSFGGGGTDQPAYFEKFGGAVLSTSINKYFYTVLQKRTDEKLETLINAMLRGGNGHGKKKLDMQ